MDQSDYTHTTCGNPAAQGRQPVRPTMQTLRPLLGLLLGLLGVVPIDLHATADSPAGTASSTEEFVDCRGVAAAQARLACYDQAANKALLGAGQSVPPMPPDPATDATTDAMIEVSSGLNAFIHQRPTAIS